tara:strand:+ start:480 stop:989 length:510 start_codon:yes stop_codon:yes gene_type:complete
MTGFKNIFLCAITICIISNCTTNKTFTEIDQDTRQVEVFNQNKKLVKTYYQKFNSKVAKWLNVTCVFANNKLSKKKLNDLDACKFTSLSNSIISNKNRETDQNFANKNLTGDNKYQNNQSNNLNENQNNNLNGNQSENFNNEGQFQNPEEFTEENHGQEFENCNDPQKC